MSNKANNGLDGFDELSELLNECIKNTDLNSVMKSLEVGAKELVKVLLCLPRPKSNITTVGYTHLVDSFAYLKNGTQVEVGWGKHYGPIVNKTQVHMDPAWNKNKESIYKKMIDSFGL